MLNSSPHLLIITLLLLLLVFSLCSGISSVVVVHAVIFPHEHRQEFDSIQESYPTLRKSSSSSSTSTIFSTPPRLDDFPSNHQDNWAVIVSSSKYWHNFRQSNNAFIMYNLLRGQGFPDDRIILFVSENHACDVQRNPDPGFSGCGRSTDFPNASTFGADIEIDFSGYGADATQFTRLLLGTQDSEIPSAKTLRSNQDSNVFVYLSSHSGEYFTKFQDYEFLSAFELNQVFQTMYRLGRYNRLFFFSDTCKGSTLFDTIDAPNIVSLSSSGPTDDGKAHGQQFNIRQAHSMVDALSSEVFDFIATLIGIENQVKKETQKEQQQQQQQQPQQNSNHYLLSIMAMKADKEFQKVAPQYRGFQKKKNVVGDGNHGSSSSLLATVTFRQLADFVVKNRYIDSKVTFSHPRALYKNLKKSDVLSNGNWLLGDFIFYKPLSSSLSQKEQKPSILDEGQRDFFIWETL